MPGNDRSLTFSLHSFPSVPPVHSVSRFRVFYYFFVCSTVPAPTLFCFFFLSLSILFVASSFVFLLVIRISHLLYFYLLLQALRCCVHGYCTLCFVFVCSSFSTTLEREARYLKKYMFTFLPCPSHSSFFISLFIPSLSYQSFLYLFSIHLCFLSLAFYSSYSFSLSFGPSFLLFVTALHASRSS